MESAGGGPDEGQGRMKYTLGGHVENLRMLAGAVSGTGNDLNNVIRGNDAANTIKALGGGYRSSDRSAKAPVPSQSSSARVTAGAADHERH